MAVEQSRISLKFGDRTLEAAYQEKLYPSSRAKSRLGIVLAIILFSAFGLTDPMVSPDNVARAWFIRFAVALPTFFVMLSLTFTSFIKKRFQLVVFLFGLSMFGYTTLLFVDGDSVIYLYPAAYLLLFLWAYVASGLTIANGTLISLTGVAIYSVIALFFNPVPTAFYWYYMLVFASAITIGFVAAYFMEMYSRQNFLTNREIEERSAELRKLSRATEQSPAVVMITDRNGVIEYLNSKFTEVTGYAVEDCIGKKPSQLKSGEQDQAFYEDLWDTILSGKEWHGEICNRKKSGDLYWESASISPIRSTNDEITHFVAVKEDITDKKVAEEAFARKSMEAQLLYQATEIAAETESFEEALQNILDQLCLEIGWPIGHVYRPSVEDPEVLEPTDIWHLEDPDAFGAFREATERSSFSVGEGLPGRVMSTGKPAWIRNVQEDANFPRAQFATDIGVSSAFAVPVQIGVETVAVLEFFSTAEISPDNDLLRIMRNVGAQTGRLLERRRIQQELEIAREAADAANKAKSAFLANMSHELRTPMNAILGYSEMLIEEAEDLEPKDFAPDLKKINQAGTHLLALINDILDLSKIEAGKTEIFTEHFDIDDLIDQATSTAQPLMEKNGNRLEIVRGERLGEVHQDLTKLRQSLLNLLSNAAKFTHEGTITVTVHKERKDDEDWLTIAVSDSGIGIAADKLDRIFEEFGQADESTTRDYGGTGLGLPISRRFCQMLGGDITLKSVAGDGSTFTINVPAVFPKTDPAVETPSRPTGGADELRTIRASGAENTVLVIDDDPKARDIIERLLSKGGFDVVTASGGKEGLRLARELQPAAITLDVIMPDMDGWMVLKSIKSDADLEDIPVVVLSVVDEEAKGYSLGATDYLTKPVDRVRLLKVLERYRSDKPK
jgi:PAS domain S-box-containing protein